MGCVNSKNEIFEPTPETYHRSHEKYKSTFNKNLNEFITRRLTKMCESSLPLPYKFYLHIPHDFMVNKNIPLSTIIEEISMILDDFGWGGKISDSLIAKDFLSKRLKEVPSDFFFFSSICTYFYRYEHDSDITKDFKYKLNTTDHQIEIEIFLPVQKKPYERRTECDVGLVKRPPHYFQECLHKKILCSTCSCSPYSTSGKSSKKMAI